MRDVKWLRVVVAAMFVAVLGVPAGGASFAGAVEPQAGEALFPDVPATHPFAAPISWLVDQGITSGFGDGSFRPSQPVSRQSMGAFLYRFGQSTWTDTAPGFPDLSPSSPFAGPVAWMVSKEITTGYGDGSFRPTAPITRQSMAVFLYRFWAKGTDAPAPAFTDVDGSHPFATEIGWLASSGVTTGYADGSFRPTAPISRQSMAAFLWRLAGEPANGAVGLNRADLSQVTIPAVAEVASVELPAAATTLFEGGDVDSVDEAEPALTTITFNAGATIPEVGALVLVEAAPSAPYGAGGRVVGVDGLAVTLAPVGIEELIPNGSVTGTSSVTVEPPAPGNPADQADELPSTVREGLDAAATAIACEATAGIDVDLGEPMFTASFDFDADWSFAEGVESVHTSATLGVQVSSQVELGAAIACSEEFDLPIPEVLLPPVFLPPPIPPIVPVIDWFGTFDLEVGLKGAAKGTLGFEITAGMDYDGTTETFTPFHDATPVSAFELTPLDEWAGGRVELFAGAELIAAWFGAVGTKIDVGPYLDLKVTPFSETAVELFVGAKAGGKLFLDAWFTEELALDFPETRLGITTILTIPKVATATDPLPNISPDTPYDEALTTEGGVPDDDEPPYTYELLPELPPPPSPVGAGGVTPSLPPGLELTPDGHITGTLAEADADQGPWTFHVKATDSIGLTDTTTHTLEVSPLEIQPDNLPDGNSTQPYNATLTATGGTEPYTWTINRGSLPPGLTLQPNGQITGTPTTGGTYNLTIRATDSTDPHPNTADHAYSIDVEGPIETSSAKIIRGEYCAITNGLQLVCSTPIVQPDPDATYVHVDGEHDRFGAQSWCAVRSDGGVDCWGHLSTGQAVGNFTQVDTDGEAACALNTQGEVTCWGDGAGNLTPPPGPFVQVDVSIRYDTSPQADDRKQACGVRVGGVVQCWGELGDDGPSGRFTHIDDVCGVRTDSSVVCLGWNQAQTEVATWNAVDLPGPGAKFVSRVFGGICVWNLESAVCTQPPSIHFVDPMFDFPGGQFVAIGVGPSTAGEVWHKQYETICGLRSTFELVCWGYQDIPFQN